MPIYEYTCQKCGATVEAMQKITDKPLSRHSKCGGKLEKQWSQTSFQLKGSGWYVTDYAGKKAEAKEVAAGDGAEKKIDSATEKKTEPTTEASATSDKKTTKEPAATSKSDSGSSDKSSSKK